MNPLNFGTKFFLWPATAYGWLRSLWTPLQSRSASEVVDADDALAVAVLPAGVAFFDSTDVECAVPPLVSKSFALSIASRFAVLVV